MKYRSGSVHQITPFPAEAGGALAAVFAEDELWRNPKTISMKRLPFFSAGKELKEQVDRKAGMTCVG